MKQQLQRLAELESLKRLKNEHVWAIKVHVMPGLCDSVRDNDRKARRLRPASRSAERKAGKESEGTDLTVKSSS